MIELANTVMNWAVLLATVFLFGCYIRRVGLLNISVHKTGSVVFHVLLGTLTFGIGIRAWYGQIGLYELLAFGVSVCWITLSFNDWREGVPARAVRAKPMGVLVALNELNELLHRE